MVQVRTSYCAAVMTCTSEGLPRQDYILAPFLATRYSPGAIHAECAHRYAKEHGLGQHQGTVIRLPDTPAPAGMPSNPDRIHTFEVTP